MANRRSRAVAASAVALAGLAAVACALPEEQHELGSAPEPANTARGVFPDDWAGRWAGELVVDGASGSQRVGFTLEIGREPDARGRPWRLGYAGQPLRDYRLVAVDAAAGRWQIDEQNGVVLDARLFAAPTDDPAPVLSTAFAVGPQLLTTRQRFHQDRIEHEIVVLRRESTPTGADVAVHEVVARQWCVLRPVGG